MKIRIMICLLATFLFLLVMGSRRTSRAQSANSTAGVFEGHGDIGTVLHPGSSEYDATHHSYTLSGSGENMWGNSDNFQLVWKKVTGDARLTAKIAFSGKGGNEHRKAVLMVRQSLDADSVYADVALHGDGLTSLQYRDEKGAATHEIQSQHSERRTSLRIEKRGDYVYMWLGEVERSCILAALRCGFRLTGNLLCGHWGLQSTIKT